MSDEQAPPEATPENGAALRKAWHLWLNTTTSVSLAHTRSEWNPASDLTREEHARLEEYLRNHPGPAGHRT